LKTSPLPKIIWQTYRTPELPPEAIACQRSWIELNPGWDYRFVDDDGIDRFVTETVPAAVYALFLSFPLGVMRADFWRYLVTRQFGGIYADLDTVCLAPLDDWLPHDAQFIVCPENNMHLCQWTYLAAPGHTCLDAVMELLIERAAGGIDTSYEHFVHFHTGPGVWTDAITASLGSDESDMIALSRRNDLPRARDLGVCILDWRYFNGFKVRHLFGSRTWGGGYGRWIEERERLTGRK
jgi:mannosyltransferase OCH1-like enzyme